MEPEARRLRLHGAVGLVEPGLQAGPREHSERGASAPETLVTALVEFFRARGTTDIEEFEVLREDVRFMLPKTIRQAVAASR